MKKYRNKLKQELYTELKQLDVNSQVKFSQCLQSLNEKYKNLGLSAMARQAVVLDVLAGE